MTPRQARRRLGSRTNRRRNTNGKALYGAQYPKGQKGKLPMRRNPRPVKSLAPRVAALIATSL